MNTTKNGWKPSSLTYGIDWQLQKAQEHYDTYEQLCQAFGIDRLKSAVGLMGRTSSTLKRLAEEDSHLNNIALREWDARAGGIVGKKHPLKPGFGLSLGEAICMLKHVAKHHIVGLERPSLTESELAAYRAGYTAL